MNTFKNFFDTNKTPSVAVAHSSNSKLRIHYYRVPFKMVLIPGRGVALFAGIYMFEWL